MKCHITTQHVASVPGYQKIYLHFSGPKNGLERLLVSILDFKKPRYIGGKEPKYSLYVGKPQEQIIEGAVARQWTPSFKKFAWTRFWAELRKDNPSYTFECRCGVWTRSDKAYNKHKKHCAVMKEFKSFLARIENTKIYQEWLHDESQRKRKTGKRIKTVATRRNKSRTKAVTASKKKVAKRRIHKHRK